MNLISITNLKLYFGERLILDIPDFKIYKGDKIGIVGANGAGKSTLLNVLNGDLNSNTGTIKVNASISYYKQFHDDEIPDSISSNCMKEAKRFKVNFYDSNLYSGGEKNRLRLAKVFSDDSDLYFFDEPTSNLDYQGILLLKHELSRINSFLLVSHDRLLLNECCNKIIEIFDSKLSIYEGNYDAYILQRDMEYKRALSEYEKYEKEKKRLLSVYQDKLIKAQKIAKKPKDRGQRIGKECGTKSFSSKAKNMQKSALAVRKKADMLEVKSKPKELPRLKIDFRLTNPPRNKYIIEINDLSFGYDSHIIFENINLRVKNGEKIAILGDNGVGKTTLLNLIVEDYSAIRRVPAVKYGYFSQGFEQLDFSKTVLENAMRDSVQNICIVRTMLARLLFPESSLAKCVRLLSGGECIRLALVKLIVSDANVLILDEPTNYLDLISREAIEKVLQEYIGTIIFASHDITFVDAIATQKFLIKDKSIAEIEEIV